MEGSSVNLKNRFAGYNIELVIKQHSANEVMVLVAEHLPGMEYITRGLVLAIVLYCRGSFEA